MSPYLIKKKTRSVSFPRTQNSHSTRSSSTCSTATNTPCRMSRKETLVSKSSRLSRRSSWWKAFARKKTRSNNCGLLTCMPTLDASLSHFKAQPSGRSCSTLSACSRAESPLTLSRIRRSLSSSRKSNCRHSKLFSTESGLNSRLTSAFKMTRSQASAISRWPARWSISSPVGPLTPDHSPYLINRRLAPTWRRWTFSKMCLIICSRTTSRTQISSCNVLTDEHL